MRAELPRPPRLHHQQGLSTTSSSVPCIHSPLPQSALPPPHPQPHPHDPPSTIAPSTPLLPNSPRPQPTARLSRPFRAERLHAQVVYYELEPLLVCSLYVPRPEDARIAGLLQSLTPRLSEMRTVVAPRWAQRLLEQVTLSERPCKDSPSTLRALSKHPPSTLQAPSEHSPSTLRRPFGRSFLSPSDAPPMPLRWPLR